MKASYIILITSLLFGLISGTSCKKQKICSAHASFFLDDEVALQEMFMPDNDSSFSEGGDKQDSLFTSATLVEPEKGAAKSKPKENKTKLEKVAFGSRKTNQQGLKGERPLESGDNFLHVLSVSELMKQTEISYKKERAEAKKLDKEAKKKDITKELMQTNEEDAINESSEEEDTVVPEHNENTESHTIDPDSSIVNPE